MSTSAPSPQDPEEGVTVRESGISVTGDGSETLFGRYRTMREIGRGGMGLVVLAHDTVLDVPVALKLVPEVVVHDSEGIGDLKKEVLRGMELTHPNIVRVFSFEQDSKTAVIVMEHVQGETLAQKKVQKPNRCFDCDEILPWIEQLCAALDYAHHEARIAHRDLKPGNLLVNAAGRLKVADFGIASSLSDTLSRVSVRRDSAGTPPYMSPQQAMGEKPTHLDDIYSLGATIYELLTGKPPFFRGNILGQVMNEEPISMAQRRAEFGVVDRSPIPEVWESVVAACLAKTPGARPESGSSIMSLLKGTVTLSASVAASNEVKVTQSKAEVVPILASLPKVSRPMVPVAPTESPMKPRRKATQGSGVIQSFADAVGGMLRLVVILVLVVGGVWGALALKKRWDAEKASEPQAAATPPPVDTPVPTAKAQSTPTPSLLDRGAKSGVQGASGLQPGANKH